MLTSKACLNSIRINCMRTAIGMNLSATPNQSTMEVTNLSRHRFVGARVDRRDMYAIHSIDTL